MRDYRYRFLGALFALSVLLTFAASDQFRFNLVGLARQQTQTSDLILAVVGLAVVLLTSEGAGYAIFSVVLAFMNWRHRKSGGFYSKLWEGIESAKLLCSQKLWADKGYWLDIRLSYFIQHGPSNIVEFIARRHTAYLTNIGAIWTIVLGFALGAALLHFGGLGCFGLWHVVELLIVGIVIAALLYNAHHAKHELRQFVSLWIALAVAPQDSEDRKGVLDHLERFLGNDRGK